MESLPDLATLTDEELKKLIDELTSEEQRGVVTAGGCCTERSTSCAPSSWRGSSETQGRSVLDQVDVDPLTEILDRQGNAPALPDGARLLP